MRTGLEMLMGLGLLVLAAAPTACAQALGAANPRAQVMLSSGSLASAEVEGSGVQGHSLGDSGELVREIDDPNNGDRWLLSRNDRYPGGPGRLVRAAVDRNEHGGAPSRAAGRAGAAAFNPVIRVGDRLIVEEHTARVDAALEALALGPAAAGSAFDVRLKMGGKVVRAVALAPGRAAFQPETEVRP